jgi:hypothetical protein
MSGSVDDGAGGLALADGAVELVGCADGRVLGRTSALDAAVATVVGVTVAPEVAGRSSKMTVWDSCVGTVST